MMLRLILCVFVLRLQLTEGNGDAVSCEEEDVKATVDIAMKSYNEKLTKGNKFAPYEIQGASKVQNDSGSLLSVIFSSLETNCPTGGDKAWKDCDYLITEDSVSMSCYAKSYLKETGPEVYSIECNKHDEPLLVPERASCMGCPLVIDVQNEDLKVPLMYSVTKFNSNYNTTHHFILNTVGSATRQVVAGFRYGLKFDMQKSNCSKVNFKELTGECHPAKEDFEFYHCNSTVDVAPWRHEVPEVNVNCAQGLLSTIFERRRPPGWSPLRSVHSFRKITPSLPPPTTVAASSEESQERTTPAGTQGGAVAWNTETPMATEMPTLLHKGHSQCPSKPWKLTVQRTGSKLSHVYPSVSETESTTPASSFDDMDLLG